MRLYCSLLMAHAALLANTAAAQVDLEGIWRPDHPPRMGQPDPATVKLTPAGRAEFEAFSPEKDSYNFV